jgi:hypothetical protein
MERIKEAAYKLFDSDTVYTGHDHAKIIRDMVEIHGIKPPIDNKAESGFITEEGKFVDRLTAADIAVKSGQIEELQWPPYLYSEDINGIKRQ